jgi:glycosyltransferase involved in cell wall biosynthesis
LGAGSAQKLREEGENSVKVGLYLKNRGIADVDLSRPEEGNPGVGGTQFNFVTLPYYFLQHFPDGAEFVWYANDTRHLPQSIPACQVEDCVEALATANQSGCDIFIWRPTHDEIGIRLIQMLDRFDVHTVAWAHNTPNVRALNGLASSSQLARFVCVGQEQLDRLRDHPIFNKSACIVNAFDPRPYIPQTPIEKDGTQVVYLGSLIPAKGFHHLARVWSSIRDQVPEATLVVVGSGKLYDRRSSLGKWGVAEEEYERELIRPDLSDPNGDVDQSVEFKGTLGVEKIRILQHADVGVVNPSGNSENCPGSALEFQAAGTPVVSGAYRGLLDTVVHKKTGLLGRGDQDLVDNVVYLLRNQEGATTYGENGIEFVKRKFPPRRVSRQWLELFSDIRSGTPVTPEPITQYPLNDYKVLREIMRLIKKRIPPARILPSLIEIKAAARRLR